MKCPNYGKDGGVLLFTSVAPCDKCTGIMSSEKKTTIVHLSYPQSGHVTGFKRARWANTAFGGPSGWIEHEKLTQWAGTALPCPTDNTGVAGPGCHLWHGVPTVKYAIEYEMEI